MKAIALFLTIVSLLHAQEVPPRSVPAGYILQILEPLGGKIVRPKEWFYTQNATSAGYNWVISKEDSKIKPYETGLRIQLFAKVKTGAGIAPKAFVARFVDEKTRAIRVTHTFPETTQGIFKRRGVEGEEKIDGRLFHIVYSGFWSDASDLAVMTIFGAPVEKWDQVADVHSRMSSFELIDMSRFENKPSEPTR